MPNIFIGEISMTDADLAFKMGSKFNKMITSTFWSSFKGKYGRVQVEVLVFLSDVESAQASEIVKELNISKQHVSLILKEFISDGYVNVVTNHKDKRANLISISERGQKFLNEHIEISNQVFDNLLSEMDKEERKLFLDSMNIIYALLSKVEKK